MSTADRIAFHARERPDAVALIDGGRSVWFGEFSRDIGKFTAALGRFGLRPGATVAVGCTDLYVHWLLLLALEQLNVATGSIDRIEDPAGYRALLASADLVLTDPDFPVAKAARHHAITDAWVRETLARGAEADPPALPRAPGDLARILRSSGSTGRPKRLASSRHMFEQRVRRYGERYQFSRGSRYILTLSFAVGHVYYSATACLRAGGTVVTVATVRGGAAIFAEHGITHVSLHPLLLRQILDDLPAGFVKPPNLAVFTFGSPMSDELGARALQRLAGEVTECFGCNEVGNVSGRRLTERDGFGRVARDVEVEVVDEEGRPVPMGRQGRLKMRSSSMVEGYLDDPEATRQFFRDGWFHPNDLAILDGPGRLKVLGRGDEVINIVGGKLAPADIEARLMQQGVVGDAGVCTFRDNDGIEELYIAVANVRLGERELLDGLTRALSDQALGRFHVVILPSIPRNPAGKIQRGPLKEAIFRALGQSSGSS